MSCRVIGGVCKCGVVHSVIVGDITRGENRRLKERHAGEVVYPVRHYVNDGTASIRCYCGAVLLIGDEQLQEVTESDTSGVITHE